VSVLLRTHTDSDWRCSRVCDLCMAIIVETMRDGPPRPSTRMPSTRADVLRSWKRSIALHKAFAVLRSSTRFQAGWYRLRREIKLSVPMGNRESRKQLTPRRPVRCGVLYSSMVSLLFFAPEDDAWRASAYVSWAL